MLDGSVKARLDPALDALARQLHRAGFSADAVTVAGFVLGLGAALAIGLNAFGLGLGLILASRLADGLDGALARQTRPTDLGGYLDIVLDFIFYGAIPLGFAVADPAANALPATVLLMSFYANGASFLAFALMAEKRKLVAAARGPKSLYFTTGLAEAGETLLVFVLACLFPAWFGILAYVFAALCFVTCFSRIALATRVFR
ncbi:membrane protein [Aureimonas sp. SA4125]|uniref:CDP-alcohol phosphatidyltransferase family protein n=1 Tax=Aureimonas sp. SA4125 TaxID=2826993 RepID=UPI001CC3FB6E|nr:CDP-alcohol phosphatidyltransferase family protein [Aureimonas sp. SA4125]BDA83569.1 membrane protein [Aureimonas sp. SA4125]